MFPLDIVSVLEHVGLDSSPASQQANLYFLLDTRLLPSALHGCS